MGSISALDYACFGGVELWNTARICEYMKNGVMPKHVEGPYRCCGCPDLPTILGDPSTMSVGETKVCYDVSSIMGTGYSGDNCDAGWFVDGDFVFDCLPIGARFMSDVRSEHQSAVTRYPSVIPPAGSNLYGAQDALTKAGIDSSKLKTPTGDTENKYAFYWQVDPGEGHDEAEICFKYSDTNDESKTTYYLWNPGGSAPEVLNTKARGGKCQSHVAEGIGPNGDDLTCVEVEGSKVSVKVVINTRDADPFWFYTNNFSRIEGETEEDSFEPAMSAMSIASMAPTCIYPTDIGGFRDLLQGSDPNGSFWQVENGLLCTTVDEAVALTYGPMFACANPSVRPVLTASEEFEIIPASYVNPSEDDAPWYDPNSCDSSRFAGLLPLEITGMDSPNITRNVSETLGNGGSAGPIRFGARTISVTALMIGMDEAALCYGMQWLTRALTEPGCGVMDKTTAIDQVFCTGAPLSFLNCCHDDFNNCPPEEWDVLCEKNDGACYHEDECNNFTNYLQACLLRGPTIVDKIYGCPGSPPLYKVEFSFYVANPYSFGNSTEVVWTSDPSIALGTMDSNCQVFAPLHEPYLNPALCGDEPCVVEEPEDECDPCRVVAIAEAPQTINDCNCEPFKMVGPMTATWSQNLQWQDSVPKICLTASCGPVRNVKICFKKNPLLLPSNDPLLAGPCNSCSCISVAYIPDGGELIIDGCSQRAVICLPGGRVRPADRYIGSTDCSTPFEWPAFSCGEPIEIQITAGAIDSCYLGLVADIEMVPRSL